MYYRRKILLGLLQIFGSRLDKVHFQKLLFLFTRLQNEKAFDFIPFKYGCFSLQATSDMNALVKSGRISDEGSCWKKIDEIDYFNLLLEDERSKILKIKEKYSLMSVEEVVKYTYSNYPYYSINSIIASDLLDKEELQKVKDQRRVKSEYILYTIGYESRSIESYINTLIVNDVRVLCDVRKNALSRKFGFSKNQLQKACQDVGIDYIHMPQLGIESEKRKHLIHQSDYDQLFEDYNKTVIKQNTKSLLDIINLINIKQRVALTCFEKDFHQCHRTQVANAIMQLPEIQFTNQIL